MGDFATVRVDGTFRLAYLVRNTIMNLTTQDEQVACFRNVARHLEPGGRFVMEVLVPHLRRLPPGETMRACTVTPTHLGFDEYDVASQRSWSHHYWVMDGCLETFSAPFRYVWASELDLMAQAGRPGSARALGRLGPLRVHEREREPRLGLGEARLRLRPGPTRQKRRRRPQGGGRRRRLVRRTKIYVALQSLARLSRGFLGGRSRRSSDERSPRLPFGRLPRPGTTP